MVELEDYDSLFELAGTELWKNRKMILIDGHGARCEASSVMENEILIQSDHLDPPETWILQILENKSKKSTYFPIWWEFGF